MDIDKRALLRALSGLGDGLNLAVGEEPIPGYRLVEQLTNAVWKATTPNGSAVAMKFVSAEKEMAKGEVRAFQFMKSLTHPHLVQVLDVQEKSGDVVVTMELCDGCLDDLYEDARRKNLPGIPRERLLELLEEGAQAIDYLNDPVHVAGGGERYGIQHCDLRAGNLLVKDGHVKLADFGLATQLFSEPGTAPSITSFATPPEFRSGRLFARSDQYSLAVVYCHLLNGTLAQPHPGFPDYRQLQNMDERDRPILRRALSEDPLERWPSCVSFIQALRGE